MHIFQAFSGISKGAYPELGGGGGGGVVRGATLVDKTEIMDEKGELSYAYCIYFSKHMGGRKVVRC